MSLTKTAEELLQVVSEIEKEAAEATTFVCEKCNHTANLATINAKRKEVAEGSKKAGKDLIVAEITVNDKVGCPACSGDMTYTPTEASEKFYIDPEKKDEEKEEKEEKPVDYDEKE
jgi:hypothetical protein